MKGLGKKARQQLGTVLKKTGDLITVGAAAKALDLPAPKAAQLLSSWNRLGWLSRVKRGVYASVPLTSTTTDVMVDDPWLLGSLLFSPCYVGGWSAAEHWDLTEQIFNSTMIITQRKVHGRKLELHGARLQLKTTTPKRFFGTRTEWIKNQTVDVSDPSKTIIDVFNDPSIGGGIRLAVEIFRSYLKSEHKNIKLLLEYADRNANSAAVKRMGFVTEQIAPEEKNLLEGCRRRIKSGVSQIDPGVNSKCLVTKWGLWVPSDWQRGLFG
jgi:predicted transcriptional regulator of viral defense system